MKAPELIAFHWKANTPLKRLAHSVRWFEEGADRAVGDDRVELRRKAKTMRSVISALFVQRDRDGQYDEAA